MSADRVHYEVGQTALAIVCDPAYLDGVRGAVHSARAIIESKISEDPFFGTTFEPYPPSKDDDPLIVRMCQASALADVGPMAGVAAAVSVRAVEHAVSKGCRHIIVENGGDIAMYTSEPSTIGVFSGDAKFRDIAFRLPPTGGMYGICSSSGRIGPSISLGNSGICTVFSNDPILADCCATAFGNMVRRGERDEMTAASERIASIGGVDGCVCVCNGLISMCGDIPEMVRADADTSLITSVRY
ncbi:MAG: UPF0280 family protein [Candidatus Methanomethylophilaceae archaeon]